MIVLNLSCSNDHVFEGWFASRDAFTSQVERSMVYCPQCNSAEIYALPSGPHVRRRDTQIAVKQEGHGEKDVAVQALQTAEPSVAQKLFAMLAVMARSAENVGERFPEEARRMHYEEAPARNIRGIATREEARDLLEEGVFVLPAPFPPESETH
jgi:hypothetical protein